MKKIIILTILSIFVIISFATAKEQENSWEGIGKWLEWKTQTDLPKKQREVVDYFKKTGDIIKRAQDIWYGQLNAKLTSAEGLKSINECIAEYKTIKPLEICRKHYGALLAYLNGAKEYQEARKNTEDVNELAKITEKSVTYSDIMASENWHVLNEIGLFDNIEEESVKLGLIDKKEVDKKYGFFKKYNKGSIIKCPICSAIMNRVKILYE